MSKINVAVLRGGPSAEYEISLETGANVLANLAKEKYRCFDIFISKAGIWHYLGKPIKPDSIFRRVDAVFNALHGEYGEDGEVQKIMEMHPMPYTGSGVFASRIAMRKDLARKAFKNAGLKIASAISATWLDDLDTVARIAMAKIGPAFVVKPASRGSSVGVHFASNFPELVKAIGETLKFDTNILIEKRIKGREATCGILENFRGEALYALPVTEIIPPSKKQFFDYESKYDGSSKEICPGRFDEKTRDKIQDIARRAHQALGLRHYSRSDMIVARDGIYILETNTLPGLTSQSLLPKAAEAIGCGFPLLLDHLVTLALTK